MEIFRAEKQEPRTKTHKAQGIPVTMKPTYGGQARQPSQQLEPLQQKTRDSSLRSE